MSQSKDKGSGDELNIDNEINILKTIKLKK
jgi:hypothetical protein